MRTDNSCRNYGQRHHRLMRYNPEYGSLKHLQNHRSTGQPKDGEEGLLPPQPQKSMLDKACLSITDPASDFGPQEQPALGAACLRSVEAISAS